MTPHDFLYLAPISEQAAQVGLTWFGPGPRTGLGADSGGYYFILFTQPTVDVQVGSGTNVPQRRQVCSHSGFRGRTKADLGPPGSRGVTRGTDKGMCL
jgi:hypothetical protein